MNDILVLVASNYADATSASRIKRTSRYCHTAITDRILRLSFANTLIRESTNPLSALSTLGFILLHHARLSASRHYAAVLSIIVEECRTSVSRYMLLARLAYLLERGARRGYEEVVEVTLQYVQMRDLGVLEDEGGEEEETEEEEGAAAVSPELDVRGALDIAAYHGHAEIVRMLAQHVCREGATDWRKPLEEAIRAGHADVVKVLLEFDVTKECIGRALKMAAENVGNEEIARLLVTIGGANMTSLALATLAGNGHFGLVRMFLEHSDRPIDPNCQALRRAAMHGHADIVALLLANGANVDFPDGAPLIMAAAGGHLEVVRVLINAKANVELYGDAAKEMAGNHAFAHSYDRIDEEKWRRCRAIRGLVDARMAELGIDPTPEPKRKRSFLKRLLCWG
ncbi:hypothetical protein HK104_002464 [Borealophlyctis nickersoniae]|nr:hypothetical protein HK104_002464 [Borealophlyctis nickersoniae]